MDILLPDFASPAIWISLLTLCFLEIVLGIDNLIFISIVAEKLPQSQQRKARNIGLLLAMVFRVVLLLFIQVIINLKEPAFIIPEVSGILESQVLISYKDLILIGGGLFLIIKSTLEIHQKIQAGNHRDKIKKKGSSFLSVIFQIVMVDAVFSFDSILTAIGLVDYVIIMIIAVVISIGVMMLFAGPVTRIINRHPTLQMLALTFLVVIGVVLIAGGLHQEVSKGIIYSCLAFSLTVELLNIRLRKNQPKG